MSQWFARLWAATIAPRAFLRPGQSDVSFVKAELQEGPAPGARSKRLVFIEGNFGSYSVDLEFH